MPVPSRTHQREYACSACWPTDPSGLLWRDKTRSRRETGCGFNDPDIKRHPWRLRSLSIAIPALSRWNSRTLQIPMRRSSVAVLAAATGGVFVPLRTHWLQHFSRQMIHFLLPPCRHHSTASSTKRKSAVHNRYDEAMKIYYPAARRWGMQSHRLVHRLVRDQMMFSP